MATISVSLPSDGTAADVSDYNTPITTIVNEINGNLDNANIKSGAAIATSKLADDAGVTTAKIADGAVTPVKRSGGFKVGYITISATGNGSVTGVGFMPKGILFLQTSGTSGTAFSMGFGAWDGTTGVSFAANSSEATGDHSGRFNSAAPISSSTGNSAADITGTVTSFDADGFSYNISTKTNNQNFIYFCFG